MRDVSKGEDGLEGSPEKRPYNISDGQNRYASLP